MDRNTEIVEKTREVLSRARQLYGVKINPKIAFNLRGRVAGWAGCRRCRYTGMASDFSLRFNSELIAGKHFEDMRDETVPHEVAHLVCYARPDLGRNHDAGWRRVCIALGGNGNSRHSYDVSHAGGSIVYVSDRGHEIKLSKIRHAKIQAGITHYTLKGGRGRVDRYCAWAPEGQTPQVHLQRPATPPPRPSWAPPFQVRQAASQPTAPAMERKPVERPAAPAPGTSWADQVRALIRQARADGRDEAWVIQQAINVLGMKPSSARNCAKANWQRA
jgi:SprT protein